MTLVELLIAISIVVLIGVAVAAMVSVCLQSYEYVASEKSALLRDGVLAMERMTRGVRTCTYVRAYYGVPGDYDVLVFSGTVNATTTVISVTASSQDRRGRLGRYEQGWLPGIRGMDDDGDGTIDEGYRETTMRTAYPRRTAEPSSITGLIPVRNAVGTS